jgi:hypothetical protein
MLKADFGDPENGWVSLALEDETAEVQVLASFTPGDSLLDLVRALHALLQEDGERTVTWYEEPRETDLRLLKCGDEIELSVHRYSGRRRVPGVADVVLRASGSYRQVCRPLWRALRELQGRFTEEELRKRWHRDFPTRELQKLTEAIRAGVGGET